MLEKFLCDEMLTRLGRWLRAAGHDTAIAAPGTPDRSLLAAAIAEDRRLLTCDRKMMERSGARRQVILLPARRVDEQVRALANALDIDWLHAPFSRCVVDNTVLRPARNDELIEAPQDISKLFGTAMKCPACGRLYWPGSHHRRMHARLERWQSAAEQA